MAAPAITTTWKEEPEEANPELPGLEGDRETALLKGLNTPESSFRSEEETEAETIPYDSESSDPEQLEGEQLALPYENRKVVVTQ